jgi:hypothetical protein
MAAQTGGASAPAPAPAPSAAPAENFWYVAPGGQTTSGSRAEVQAQINAGYNKPVMRVGENAWKSAAELGFTVPSAAPAAPAAPTAPVAPIAPAAPVLPAVASHAVPMTSVAPSVPTTAVAGAYRPLPALITDPAAAIERLKALAAAAPVSDTNLHGLVEEADSDGGGMSHTFPFVSLRNGSWKEPKDFDKNLAQYLPAGARPFSAVFLGYRISATGWRGQAGKGNTGVPLWRFALPNLLCNTALADQALVRDVTSRVLTIARDVQYTKAAEKSKYDGVGRMAIETHLLVWAPGIGLMCMVVPGWETSDLTMQSASKAQGMGQLMRPFQVVVKTHTVINKKKQKQLQAGENIDPKTVSWDLQYADIELDTSPVGMTLYQNFQGLQNNPEALTALANSLESFNAARDYSGLSLEEVADLVTKYDAIG